MRNLKYLTSMMAVGVGLLICVPQGEAALLFSWGVDAPGRLQDSSSVVLTGSQSDSSIGGFIQLIFDGGDGLDALDIGETDGIPAAGNDLVVATGWVGRGAVFDAPALTDGFMSGVDDIDGVGGYVATAGDMFYIRYFDTASPSYGTGAIPTTGNYADLGPHVLTEQEINGEAAQFAITSNQQTTNPVPEPSTMALFAIGGLVAAGMRRRAKRS